jgi:hypothetical protein
LNPTFALGPQDGDPMPKGDEFQAGAATKTEREHRNETIAIMPTTVRRWRKNRYPFSTHWRFEHGQLLAQAAFNHQLS